MSNVTIPSQPPSIIYHDYQLHHRHMMQRNIGWLAQELLGNNTRQKALSMTDMYRFNQYLSLADQLASVATKEDLAECARLLAINVAHYQSVYGELPLDETLEMAYAEAPNQAQIDLMTRGMETLVGVLGGIVQGFDDKPAN